MRYQLNVLVLMGCLLFAQAAVERPAQLKAMRRSASFFNEPANVGKFRSNDGVDAIELDENNEKLSIAAGAAVAGSQSITGGGSTISNSGSKDASSGRLFLKKFLLFKNMFGSSQQPVIPIIITGANNSPTTTLTSSPTATGTVTPTSPTTSPPSLASPVRTAENRGYFNEQSVDLDQDNEDADADAGTDHGDTAELIDEQALQAALANGAQEYEVVSDDVQESNISGSSESKASQSSRINLRRKGSRRGQVISVRIPPRYRRYFKKGQKVMLNAKNGSRPNKRRIIRRRGQSNRRRNKNKKNRKGKRPRISG